MPTRERPDEIPDLTRIYHRVEKLHKHVVNEDDPSSGVLARLDVAETQIDQNSKDIRTIKTIPLRIAWVAVVAIVGTAAVGVATLVWYARPAVSTKATP